jgi:uncharacterized damage-inducible protein DinB
MTELEQVLAGDSAHTPPSGILGDLDAETAGRAVSATPHTIYQELWHVAYWQQITLDWVRGIETPVPEHASSGFPNAVDAAAESWEQLRERFFATCRQAVTIAGDAAGLETLVRCPSRPGLPVRVMSVRDQLESLGAHNAYHFGRIVLLRQLLGAWPPATGGYSW